MLVIRLLWMLRKHLLALVLLIAVGAGAGYGFTLIPPAFFTEAPLLSKLPLPSAYQSSVSLVLNASDPNGPVPYVAGALQGSNGITPAMATLASTYGAYLQSDTFARLLNQRLNLSADPQALSKAISVKLVPNTNLLTVTVRWTTADNAQRIASTIATVFVDGDGTTGGQASALGRGTLLAALQTQADQAKQQIALVQARIVNVQQDSTLTAAERASVLSSLQQELVGLQDNYSNTLTALASQAPVGSDFRPARLLDAAQPGKKTPRPWMSTLIGTLSGVALGLSLMALLEYLDVTVDAAADLEADLGARVLGAVGVIPRWRWLWPWEHRGAPGPTAQPGIAPQLVMIGQPATRNAEAFRLVRAMLELGASDAPPRTLLVTSAGTGEGKSFVAANLAIALAQHDRRVILVDADLHRPSLHRLFGLDNEVGLSDLLSPHNGGTITPDSPLLRRIADLPNLRVMTRGSSSEQASDLLSSALARDILTMLPQFADLVVYDAGPAPSVAGVLSLASQVDGVIVVARSRQTSRTAVSHLGDLLRHVGAHISGGILNGAPAGQLSTYYSGQYRGRLHSQELPTDSLPEGRTATARGA